MHLTQARRVVLLSFNPTTRTIDFRHYLITVRPVGISRGLRRLSTPSSSLPNLSSATDVADLLLNRDTFVSSASEAESDASGEEGGSKVVLAQDYVGRSNKKSQRRAIRLTELGPRMELGLLKIEDGLGGGESETLFHEFGTFASPRCRSTEPGAFALNTSRGVRLQSKSHLKRQRSSPRFKRRRKR
jgi:ribosome biogenesis protein SSF1/2